MGKIFGIGWAKTGTTTLGECFEILGYSHKAQELNLVYDVSAGRLDRAFSIADQFEAFEDWPWILIYKELDRRYPQSKFILTVRNKGAWWLSYENMMKTETVREDTREIRKIIYQFESGIGNKHECVARYERHNAEVLNYFADRPGDLLVVDWEEGDGWSALCRFLGRNEPERPFPHRNRGSYKPRWFGLRRMPALGSIRRTG